MNENMSERNRKLSEVVIKGLKSRGMEGYFAETKEEALKQALSLIPDGAKVGWGGSLSVDEIGLKEKIKEGNYEWRDREGAANPEEKREAELFSHASDWYLCSSNAITEDGVLVNIDGSGNRVAAMASGPLHVLFIVGMNKVTKDVDAAVYRARNVAATANTQRFPIQTPCKVNGACANCKSPTCICCSVLVTRFCRVPDRMHIILVNEDLGF